MNLKKGRYWPILFIVISVHSSISNHKGQIWNGFGLEATWGEASASWGWSDPGTYLKTGSSLIVNGGLTEEFHWVAHLWTLGTPGLFASSLYIVGIGGQFMVPILALALASWYISLNIFSKACTNIGLHPIASSTAISLFILTPMFREYLIGRSLIYSDGMSIVGLFFVVVKTWQLSLNSKDSNGKSKSGILNSSSNHMLAGVVLGLVVLFRHQYFLTVQILIFSFLLLVLYFMYIFFAKTVSRVGPVRRYEERKSSLLKLLWHMALMIFGTLLIIAPYSVWKANKFGDIPWDTGGKYVLTSTEGLGFMANWGIRDDFPDFIREGGQGTACIVDPIRCEEIQRSEIESGDPFNIYDDEPYTASDYRSFTVETFFNSPIAWTFDRMPYFLDFFGRDPISNSPGGWKSVPYLASLAVFGSAGLFQMLYQSRSQNDRRILGLYLPLAVLAGVIVATFLPPFVAHYETRYLVPLRVLLMTFSFFWLVKISQDLILRRRAPKIGAHI